jgi:hypothetical protein
VPPVEIRRLVRSGDVDQLVDGRIVAIIDGVLEPGPIVPIDEYAGRAATQTSNIIEFQQAELGWQAVQK